MVHYLFVDPITNNNILFIMKEYLDIQYLKQELFSLLTEARNNYGEDAMKEDIKSYYDDGYINEYCEELCDEFNDDMKHYLHNKDHSMAGNFNNIDYCYSKYRVGKYEHKRRLVDELTERLDAGDQSEQTKKDKHWLVDWFFETFGTFGIKYNFQTMMSEYLYNLEKEINYETN